MKIFDPILTCEQAQNLEDRIIGVSDADSFAAMTRAGTGVSKMFLEEFGAMLPRSPQILALVGNGHNGGDALIALKGICQKFPDAKVCIAYGGVDKLKKNTKRAFANLLNSLPEKSVETVNSDYLSQVAERRFDLIIDGIAGMSFRPPARQSMVEEIETANKIDAKIRISMDIPSGASITPQKTVFRADATYAAGICKDVIFAPFNKEFVGRIRYVDVGFFDNENYFEEYAKEKYFITRADALSFMNELRPAISDKRSYGHLFIIAGSRSFPGAALLATRAALRAGVGLVTSFVPETLAPSFAASEPSAIWVGCPEDENGAIALESLGLIRSKLKAATCILAGSGITNSPETRALVAEILKLTPDMPAVLDADAICRELVSILPQRNADALLTPHEGEILRIAGDASNTELLEACKKYKCAIALKSSATRVSDGEIIVRQVRGNPALARAGSGDILSGIAGSLMANKSFKFKNRPLCVGICASQCLGLAAEKAFAKFGETAIATSDIANFIPDALKEF